MSQISAVISLPREEYLLAEQSGYAFFPEMDPLPVGYVGRGESVLADPACSTFMTC
jgi:hypothetical protein